MNFMNI